MEKNANDISQTFLQVDDQLLDAPQDCHVIRLNLVASESQRLILYRYFHDYDDFMVRFLREGIQIYPCPATQALSHQTDKTNAIPSGSQGRGIPLQTLFGGGSRSTRIVQRSCFP